MAESAKQESKKKKATAAEATVASDGSTQEQAPAPAKAAKKKRRKRRVKAASASEAAASAAPAKAKVSKTQAVKAYLAKSPDAGPTEIVTALKAEGIDITPNYVSNLKFHLKTKRKGRKPKAAVQKSAAPKSSKSQGLSIASLVAAKKAAEALGGVQLALQALQAISQLFGDD